MSNNKKKILVITPSLSISGGRERVMSNFAQHLCREFDLLFVTLDNKTGSFFPMPAEVGIETIDSYMMGDRAVDNNKLGYIKDVLKIRAVLKKHADRHIVIGTDFLINIYIGCTGLSGKRFLIAQEHLIFDIPERNAFWTRMRNRIYRKKVKIAVTLTERDKLQYESIGVRAMTIPNALTFDNTRKAGMTGNTILAVGRFSHEKGFDMLIKAFALVAGKYPDWTLKLIGEGPLKETFTALIAEKQLGGQVIIEPPTPHIREKYLEAAFYVLSSRHEAFPMVLMETMSHGVPAVSFDCDAGPREIIRAGEDGLLVPREDINSLADGISFMIEHPDIRKEMGAKAYKNIQRFAPEQIYNKWIGVLNNETL